ncbi:putative helix-turn-helix domain of transposase IS66 [Acidithrix ferrooxidans]|uniref:Putative helix-turn-helix domain of transposase IS66 n=1 Tax=Acidithrix ferrooxidans TaxID=1280514 RepID=A0A0D8HHX0_9ACTN|nr:putative helix-turn-helix domain of transposase IS66 [Acidithrix ferrooxidans]
MRQYDNERIASLEAENVVLRSERDELSAKVDALTAKIVELTKQAFGRRSERAKMAQDVNAEPIGALEESSDPEPDEVPRRKRGQQLGHRGHGRRSYDHLPRVQQIHEPDSKLLVCGSCGAPYAPFGEERCEEIDVEVIVRVIDHIRPTYRRGCNCKATRGRSWRTTSEGSSKKVGCRLGSSPISWWRSFSLGSRSTGYVQHLRCKGPTSLLRLWWERCVA